MAKMAITMIATTTATMTSVRRRSAGGRAGIAVPVGGLAAWGLAAWVAAV
jgi:hypothetical protein